MTWTRLSPQTTSGPLRLGGTPRRRAVIQSNMTRSVRFHDADFGPATSAGWRPGKLLCALLAVGALFLASRGSASQFEGLPLSHGRLENGLSVWHLQRPGASVALFLMVNVGSRHEDPGQAGIAHLVEHMVLAGTERWSESEVRREAGRLGANTNGITTQDRTTYYIATSRDHLRSAMAWLAEVTLHPTLAPEHIDRVRDVVLREMGGEPGRVLQWARAAGFGNLDLAQAFAALFPGSGLDQLPIGREHTLAALTHQDIVDFYRTHYHPGNAVLMVVGDAEESVSSLVAEHFGGWKGNGRGITRAKPPQPMSGPVHFVQRGLEHTSRGTLWLGARTKGGASEEVIPLTVLASYLSETLFEQLRVNDSLVYAVSVSPRFFEDAGVLWVRTESRRDLVDQIAERIDEEIKNVATGRIDADALERAKSALAGRRTLRLESSVSLGFELLSQLTPTSDHPPADFAERMKHVDAAELQATAARVFAPPNRLTAIHRPFTDVDTLVGVGAVLLLGLVGWFIVARRRSARPSTALRTAFSLPKRSTPPHTR